MSKVAIWRRSKNLPPMSTDQTLYRDALSALFWIVISAVAGVILITITGELIIAGVLGSFNDAATGRTDEAISVLAQIGSGAVGAMAGWLTRDRLIGKDTGFQQLPPEPTPEEVAMPLPIEEDPVQFADVEQADEFPPPEEIEEDVTEVVDEDFVWPDEPDGDEDVDFDDEEVRDA